MLFVAVRNLSFSLQTSGLAFVSPLSLPSMKPANGSFDNVAAISALSIAALASNGALPLAIAPMRPKWAAIKVIPALRYLIASSGLANCAAAGSAVTRPAAAATPRISFFIQVLQDKCVGSAIERV